MRNRRASTLRHHRSLFADYIKRQLSRFTLEQDRLYPIREEAVYSWAVLDTIPSPVRRNCGIRIGLRGSQCRDTHTHTRYRQSGPELRRSIAWRGVDEWMANGQITPEAGSSRCSALLKWENRAPERYFNYPIVCHHVLSMNIFNRNLYTHGNGARDNVCDIEYGSKEEMRRKDNPASLGG
ncbi:hypothetical protein B0J17DRAFT_632207 [Rhizoctonia solani]|nr:hypothetical protein B0J17DRAFT_632207 [Rhizoctonia solani]